MLHDGIAAALPMLRAHAESLMVDACRVERQRVDGNGDPVYDLDPETLAEVPVFDEVHAGRCRVQRREVTATPEQVAGGFEFGVASVEVQLPIGVAAPARGDRVTVTAATFDPSLVGSQVVVVAVPVKTHATKRVLMCRGVDDAA